MNYSPNRDGGYVHGDAERTYREIGDDIAKHVARRPLDRNGVALDFHYGQGLIAAGCPRDKADAIVEALRADQRARWDAERAARGY